VLLVLSAQPMSVEAHDKLTALCPNGGDDDYGEKTIEPGCYRKLFYDFSPESKFAEYWASFPNLMKFVRGLDAERLAEVRRYVETASRKGGYQEKTYFDSSDAQSAIVLFHYLEGLFLRFDEDADGDIDVKEAEKAFPNFKLTLAEFAEMTKNPDHPRLKKIFMYLLDKGRPPVTDDMGRWKRFWNGVGFIFWSWRTPDFEADRLGLLKVFAAIASPPPPKP
jgi:hypothetical protein